MIYEEILLSEFSKDCPEDKEPIAFSVKLDSDYDCEDSDIKNESNDDEKKKKCIYYNNHTPDQYHLCHRLQEHI